MHEVHTESRFGVPPTTARTVWMFGFQRRGVRRCECEIELPKPGLLPQMSQVAATGTPSSTGIAVPRLVRPGGIPPRATSAWYPVRSDDPKPVTCALSTADLGVRPEPAATLHARVTGRGRMAGVEPVLDAHVVLRWCRAALAGLADAREEIDALNVYPVPDGDTGTNLYLTLESATLAAEQVCADAPSPQMGPVLHAVARGALLGARGNSGVILSQMLRGVAEVLADGDDSRPEPVAFADALVRAADAGYAAVADPVEGTILSVARAAADAARTSAAADDATLPHVALVAARAAREALASTPDQLEVLRRSGVVDAGGRGLTVVLDAFDTVLTGRRQLEYPRPVGGHQVPAVAATEPIAQSPAYEVMYLLDAPDDTVPALKAALEPLGDSLIVVGGAPLWNVHIHVDDVGAAIEAGIAAGRPHRIRVTHLAAQTARPATSASGRALVAFAAGDGLAALFESAGAIVVRTPVGRPPATREMLEGGSPW